MSLRRPKTEVTAHKQSNPIRNFTLSTEEYTLTVTHFIAAHIKYDSCNVGSFSNGEGEVNETGKQKITLDWQNNNSATAKRFFVYFFAVTARLQRENA